LFSLAATTASKATINAALKAEANVGERETFAGWSGALGGVSVTSSERRTEGEASLSVMTLAAAFSGLLALVCLDGTEVFLPLRGRLRNALLQQVRKIAMQLR
jgi:hypothetical protein